jgi:hypothetical protein
MALSSYFHIFLGTKRIRIRIVKENIHGFKGYKKSFI